MGPITSRTNELHVQDGGPTVELQVGFERRFRHNAIIAPLLQAKNCRVAGFDYNCVSDMDMLDWKSTPKSS